MGPQKIYSRETEEEETSQLIHGPGEDDGFDELTRARSPRQLQNHVNFDLDPVASGFSRISYRVQALATDDEVEAAKALDSGKGDGVVGVMFGKGVREQMFSSWFMWVVHSSSRIRAAELASQHHLPLPLCANASQITDTDLAQHMLTSIIDVLCRIRINWYLATVQSQLEFYTGDAELADTLTKGELPEDMPLSTLADSFCICLAFTVLLPLGGIIGIPFVGFLLDTRSMFEATVVLTIIGLAFGILTSLSQTVPQLMGIGCLVFLRPLFYTYVSDYFAKIFG
jgi:hypothetical protein